MITARPPFGARRTCRRAGALRLCWLGVLLLGVLYAHGIGVEGGSGHLSPETVTSSVAVARTVDRTPSPGVASAHDADAAGEDASGDDASGDPDGTGHRHGEGSSHPGGECLSVQPQDGPCLAAPAMSCTLDSAAAHGRRATSGTGLPDGAWRGSHGPPCSGGTAVLRI
ncbi:hypothetical protein ACWD4J_07585 [Streptomyces sp. NPDC002577]